MARRQGTAISICLPWVLLQGGLFLPAVVGMFGHRESEGAPWGWWVLSALLASWLGYCLVRNLALMWVAPVSETRRWHVAPLFVLGLLLALLASGLLLDGAPNDRPKGGAVLIVALSVLALGVREVVRLRRAGGARTHDPRIMSPLL